tara:strand:+ start:955 stop:1671 length:717 start_codon:yes stop_codon:yes gene_type:complete
MGKDWNQNAQTDMTMKYLILITSIFFSASIYGEDSVLPQSARKLIDYKNKTTEKYTKEYQIKVQSLEKRLIPLLETEKIRETKRRNLEGALAIKAEIEKLKMNQPDFLAANSARSPEMTVEGVGVKDDLQRGELSLSNRSYEWIEVDDQLLGKKYTFNAGGVSQKISFDVDSPGMVYVAIRDVENNTLDISILKDLGFKETELNINYNKGEMLVYQKVCRTDFKLPKANAFGGFIVIW